MVTLTRLSYDVLFLLCCPLTFKSTSRHGMTREAPVSAWRGHDLVLLSTALHTARGYLTSRPPPNAPVSRQAKEELVLELLDPRRVAVL